MTNILTVGTSGAQFATMAAALASPLFTDDTEIHVEPGFQAGKNEKWLIEKHGVAIIAVGAGSPLDANLNPNPNWNPAELGAEMGVYCGNLDRNAAVTATGYSRAILDPRIDAALAAFTKTTAVAGPRGPIPVTLPNGQVHNVMCNYTSWTTKGIITIKEEISDFCLEGWKMWNGFSSEPNAAIFRGQGRGVFINNCHLFNAYDGVKTGDQFGPLDPEGAWKLLAGGNADLFGWAVVANSIIELCGNKGFEHGSYLSPALFNIAAGNLYRGVRGDGHSSKMFGGFQIVYGNKFPDDPGAETGTNIDASSGRTFIVDNEVTQCDQPDKQPQLVLHRNNRIPSLIGNVFVARGNTMRAVNHNNGAFFKTIEYPYHGGDSPANTLGSPGPIVRDVRDNLCVFRRYLKQNSSGVWVDDGLSYGAAPFIASVSEWFNNKDNLTPNPMTEAVNNAVIEETDWIAAGSPRAAKVFPTPLHFTRANWKTEARKIIALHPASLPYADQFFANLLPLPPLPEEDPAVIAELQAQLDAATLINSNLAAQIATQAGQLSTMQDQIDQLELDIDAHAGELAAKDAEIAASGVAVANFSAAKSSWATFVAKMAT